MKTRTLLSALVLFLFMQFDATAIGWASKHNFNRTTRSIQAKPAQMQRVCLSANPIKNTNSKRSGFDIVKKRVTLTCYWSNGSGTDYYSRKGMSATGVKLQSGKHVAVDKKIFPYGSKIVFPDGSSCIAVDTGTAVRNKVASRKLGVNYPVVDRYFKNKSDALRYDGSQPKFVDVVAYIPRG